MDVREKLRQSFNEGFEHWAIELPIDAMEPGVVWLIFHHGWTIWTRYDVEDEREYLDYYARHRMTNDRHERMYVDGDYVGFLPTTDLIVGDATEAEIAAHLRSAATRPVAAPWRALAGAGLWCPVVHPVASQDTAFGERKP